MQQFRTAIPPEGGWQDRKHLTRLCRFAAFSPGALLPVASFACGHLTTGRTLVLNLDGAMTEESIFGEVVAKGVLCPQFRIDGGENISLEAVPAGTQALVPGQRLHLTGQFVHVSRCMQGRGFRVGSIDDPLPAPED